jgi:hypothetical protein
MPKSHWIRWSTPCGKPLRTWTTNTRKLQRADSRSGEHVWLLIVTDVR